MKVLIAGGAGYIGSTVASACLDAGITPVILDDLSTGREEFTRGREFYQGDLADPVLLDKIFAEHPDIDAAILAAALIVVPDSVADPVSYYRVNVAGGLEFAASLLRNGCHRLLFSSSASIYAPAADLTVDEDSSLEPGSPYARTKAMTEQILADIAAATPLRVLSLRYFNPVGADPLLRTGQQLAEPSHALGKLLTAMERRSRFLVTGTDYPTRDGTGIRDYVHVWDLASAHVAALRRFDEVTGEGRVVINLGTGSGTTVRELITAAGRVTGQLPEVADAPRRPGDVAGAYTRIGRARRLLGWEPRFALDDGIRDSLRWNEVRDRKLTGPGS